jgi:hypothetical protein
MLQARLDYSAGRLTEARDHFAAAVEEARSVGHLAIEARALLYLGVVEGCLGDSAAAELHLRQAQQRLQARGQYNFGCMPCWPCPSSLPLRVTRRAPLDTSNRRAPCVSSSAAAASIR